MTFSAFLAYQYFGHPNYFEIFVTLLNVFNDVKFC